MKMESNNYDEKKLKELSVDELQKLLREGKSKVEQLEELARKRGINLTETRRSTLQNGERQEHNESLAYPCPKCGRYYGRSDVKKTLERRVGRKSEGKRERRPNTRIIKDFRDNEIPVPINRLSNPSKIWNVFDFTGDTNQPVIYPGLAPETPRPKKGTDSYRMQREALGLTLELEKNIVLFCDMSKAIYNKFPGRRREIGELIYECVRAIRLVTRMMKSATDDRYKRSITEWVSITKYAMETSPEAASKRFYGITPDGKKLRLSPKHIKDMIEEVNNFLDEFTEFIPKVALNIRTLNNIARNDPELSQLFEKLSKQYDDENKQKILETMEGSDEDNGGTHNQSKNHDYQYSYYKIVHYDKDLYEKQKSEHQKGIRKSKPDGRIECRVKAEDLGF
jgi:hypothetical protein